MLAPGQRVVDLDNFINPGAPAEPGLQTFAAAVGLVNVIFGADRNPVDLINLKMGD